MKKSSSILFLFITLLAASAITLCKGEEEEEEERSSVRGITSRFLGVIPHGSITNCQKNPRVCLVEGSAGPDCCSNKCVNLETDAFNCGRCGKKCGYQKICCEGKCVIPMTNEKHCGKCGSKCDEASSCVYGMCSYA